MDRQQIIMNYTVPPSTDDFASIAQSILESLPEELLELCEGTVLEIEDMPNETHESELDLEDPYELTALLKRGSQISPGIESKTANDDDTLTLFRRPILDVWCESGDDLNDVVRQIMIEELGENYEFSEEEIDEMAQRHYQGML